MYDYSLPQWLLIFYIYCFAGWIFESTVVSVQKRRLINRGFLRGPMLPIYGFGAVIMLHVSLPLTGHPVQIYFAGLIVATAFEYAVSAAMEAIFKVKYWDYSEHRFQFQGRICLQSSLAWGGLSLLLVYVLHPPVEDLLEQFNFVPLMFTSSVLTVYFLTDAVASIKTALDFTKLLKELDDMRIHADNLRTQFAAAAWKKRAELTAAAQESREKLAASTENARLQAYLAIQAAEDELTHKIQTMKQSRKWLVRGNPGLRSRQFDRTLREVKRRLEEFKK